MAEVSICVPAWQAEAFIDRTLRCARHQTFSDVAILVSVDRCEDRTAEICRQHAREDDRVQVLEQPERLGWSRNANALLDRVETDLFFLYFHDDVLEPTYVERLHAALHDAPAALSAHCDLQHFGENEAVLPGVRYDGPPAQRMLRWLAGPVKGTTLRSLTWRSALDAGLRFPVTGDDGFWRAWPYHLMLAGLGPAEHVPEVLYRRWMREGSVTKTWHPRAFESLLEGLRGSAEVCLDFVASLGLAPLDEAAVRYGMYLQWVFRLRTGEAELSRHDALLDPGRLVPAFAEFAEIAEDDAVVASQPDEVQLWLHDAAERLARATRRAERAIQGRVHG